MSSISSIVKQYGNLTSNKAKNTSQSKSSSKSKATVNTNASISDIAKQYGNLTSSPSKNNFKSSSDLDSLQNIVKKYGNMTGTPKTGEFGGYEKASDWFFKSGEAYRSEWGKGAYDGFDSATDWYQHQQFGGYGSATKWFNANQKYLANRKNFKTIPSKRGTLDRILGVLGNNSIVEGLYNVTDDDDNTTFWGGVKEGFKYMNPFTDDVSERNTFSDVLKNVGWEDKPEGKANVGRAIVGFIGDVLLDPLTYINPFSGAGKVAKGSGITLDTVKAAKKVAYAQKIGAEASDAVNGVVRGTNVRNLANITYNDAEKIVMRNNKLLSEEELEKRTVDLLTRYNKKVHGARALDQGEGLSVGLKHAIPFADKTTEKFTKELISSEALRRFGDKTIAPYFNSLVKKFRTSSVGKKLSTSNELLRFAQDENELQAFKRFILNRDLTGVDKAVNNDAVRETADIIKEYENDLKADGFTEEDILTLIDQYENGNLQAGRTVKEVRERLKNKLTDEHADNNMKFTENVESAMSVHDATKADFSPSGAKFSEIAKTLDESDINNGLLASSMKFASQKGYVSKSVLAKKFNIDEAQSEKIVQLLTDIGIVSPSKTAFKPLALPSREVKFLYSSKLTPSSDFENDFQRLSRLQDEAHETAVKYMETKKYANIDGLSDEIGFAIKDEAKKAPSGVDEDGKFLNAIDNLYDEIISNPETLSEFMNIQTKRDAEVFYEEALKKFRNIIRFHNKEEETALEFTKRHFDYIKSNPKKVKKYVSDKLLNLDKDVARKAEIDFRGNVARTFFREAYTVFGKTFDKLDPAEANHLYDVARRIHNPLTGIPKRSDGSFAWSELAYLISKESLGKFYDSFKQNNSKLSSSLDKHIEKLFFKLSPEKQQHALRKFADDVIENVKKELSSISKEVKITDDVLKQMPPLHQVVYEKVKGYNAFVKASKNYDKVQAELVSELIKHTEQAEILQARDEISRFLRDSTSDNICDDIETTVQDELGIRFKASADELEHIEELSGDERVQVLFNFFADSMKRIGIDEFDYGRLNEASLGRNAHEYFPHFLSDDTKVAFGFEKDANLSTGKFNPSQHGNKADFNYGRKYKTVKEGQEAWVRFNRGLMWKECLESGLSKQETYKYVKKNFDAKKVSNAYVTCISEAYLTRAIRHNDIIQETRINSFIKNSLCTPFKHSVEKDRVVCSYIDTNKKISKIVYNNLEKRGLEPRFVTPDVFDAEKSRLLKKLGINEEFWGSNIAYPEVTTQQARLIGKLAKDEVALYNMDEGVFNTVNTFTRIQMDSMRSGFLRLFDTLQTQWKLLNTIVMPGFHIQNAVSNAFQSFLSVGSDAFNPRKLTRAYNIIKTGDPKQTLKLGEEVYTYSRLKKLAEETGILSNTFFKKEFVNGKFKEIAVEQKSLNPFYNIGTKVGTTIEGVQRFNLFLSYLDKGIGIEDAVENVNKFLFDYGDLTSFEQNVLKRIIPFYTFMRKNIPMELEMMMEKPWIFNNLNKMFTSIENMNENLVHENERNEFRQEYIQLPDSINGEEYGIANQLPYNQIDRVLSPAKLLGQTTPLIKTPIELLTGEYVYTGMPINGDNFAEKASEYVQSLFSPSKVNYLANTTKDAGIERELYILGQLSGFPINKIKKNYVPNEKDKK